MLVASGTVMGLALEFGVHHFDEGFVVLDEFLEEIYRDGELATGLVAAGSEDGFAGGVISDLETAGDEITDGDEVFKILGDFGIAVFGDSLFDRPAEIAGITVD